MMSPDQILSECYELVESSDLQQGDIIRDGPILRPPADFNWPRENDDEEVEIETEQQDLIVLSQTCDLVSGQKRDMWLVVMCPMWTLDEISVDNAYLASGYGREMCKQGALPGYYLLPECKKGSYELPISIISFREVWSLPLALVTRLCSSAGQRLRLRSPYREHLSQAFGRYFMRVAVNYDELFPSFENSKEEKEIMKNFKKMSKESRERMIKALQSEE